MSEGLRAGGALLCSGSGPSGVVRAPAWGKHHSPISVGATGTFLKVIGRSWGVRPAANRVRAGCAVRPRGPRRCGSPAVVSTVRRRSAVLWTGIGGASEHLPSVSHTLYVHVKDLVPHCKQSRLCHSGVTAPVGVPGPCSLPPRKGHLSATEETRSPLLLQLPPPRRDTGAQHAPGAPWAPLPVAFQ